MWKFAFVFCVVVLSSGWIAGAVDDAVSVTTGDSDNGQKFSQEIECSKAGGICIHRKDCPPDKFSEEGQCPKQSNLGAVCCHSLSISETRCQQLGGHCRETCPEEMTIARANDCGEGEKCCPLV